MVTLRDIARAADVHPTTVSSILHPSSGNSRSSEETRRKVLEVAKKLGYTRNHLAKSLRTRRTGTIGLVAGNIQNPFFATLSAQLEEHLRAEGYELLLTCHGSDSAQDESELAQTLLARSVDGLLIWSEQRDGKSPRHPTGSTAPRVWLGYGPRGETAIAIDIAKGLSLAVEHLQAQGIQRIGYYAPSYARTAGLPKCRPALLDEVCSKYGLPPSVPLFYTEESWNLAAAKRAAFPLIQTAREAGVQAVLGYNDVSAVGWHLAAQEQNFDCPTVAFDGSPLAQAWHSQLPYVDLHSDTLARKAVALICSQLKGEAQKNRSKIKPTFVASERT